mmetsp:Transcript_9410/g.20641  ORF Transcript_9410/g.20641 Transcript_9410/m.20641 type:complete len:205 (+) Transcript_9410:717-1331(+)
MPRSANDRSITHTASAIPPLQSLLSPLQHTFASFLKHRLRRPAAAPAYCSPWHPGQVPYSGMDSVFTCGRLSTSRPFSSRAVAARTSSLSCSGEAALQASVSLASRAAWSRLVTSKSVSIAVRWNSGMVKAAPMVPGHRFMPWISSRTSSRYLDPFSKAPHSSWASLVAISTFLRVFSSVSISDRTPTNSCWARRMVLILSACS